MSVENQNLTVDAAALANAIVTATEQISGNRRQIPFGKHNVRTAFNPEGKNRKMLKTFYQNGYRASENTLSDAEIELIHLVKPGRYLDGLVTIVEIPDDADTGTAAIHVKYNNRTADQRMALGQRIGGVRKGDTPLRNMLQMILDEHAELAAQAKAARKAEIEDAFSA